MSHLVLFFLVFNLTHVCLEISFNEGSYCAGTIQLTCGANHMTGSCMVWVFAGGCFQADFSCLIFCHYRFYHWYSHKCHRIIEEFKCFLFYLSMLIDGVLWRARLGIFNAFKFQTQVKPNMKNLLLFLKIFLFFINYVYARLIYLISFPKFRFLTNILQLVDVDILFLLYIKILLYFCGDIEINPGPKRSSFTFCL